MTDEPNLDRKILDWLHKQGYPLELRVARTLESSGIWAHHSRLYPDPTTGTYREIDLVAFATEGTHVSVHLMIECKSGEKPWIAFRSTTTMLSEFGVLAATGVKTTEAYDAVLELSDGSYSEAVGGPLFESRYRAAFNLTQAFTSGADAAYGAVESSIAAARGWSRPDRGLAIVALPVIVVSAPLYEASSDVSDEIVIRRIDRVALLRASTAGMEPLFVDVVTEDAFGCYVADAVAWGLQLETCMS